MKNNGITAMHRSIAKDSLSFFYRPFIELDCIMTKHLVSERAFNDTQLVIGDVGVRAGFDPRWDIFGEQCVLVGFDPDKDECVRLETLYSNTASKGGPQKYIEEIALWEYEGVVDFYITKDTNTASCFPPNMAFFRRLPDSSPMEVIKTVKVNVSTLDAYCKKTNRAFDVLKIDVQGGELSVLNGAHEQMTNSVIAVIVEVEFVSLYEGQPLFCDIDNFMRKYGFALFDLDIRRWRRKQLPETFDGIRVGQTIYADALYLWDPIAGQMGKTKVNKLLKLAALAECFAVPDYAMEILSFAKRCGVINENKEKELIGLLESNTIIARHDRNIIL